MRKLINNSIVNDRDVFSKLNFNVINIDTTKDRINFGLSTDEIYLSYEKDQVELYDASVYDYEVINTKHASIGDTHAMNVGNKLNSLYGRKFSLPIVKAEWAEIANEIVKKLTNEHGYITSPGALSSSGNNKLDERFLKRFTDALMKDTGNDNSKLETLGQLMVSLGLLDKLSNIGNELNGVTNEDKKREVANKLISELESFRKFDGLASTNLARHGVNTKVDPTIDYPDYSPQNTATPNRNDGIYPYGHKWDDQDKHPLAYLGSNDKYKMALTRDPTQEELESGLYPYAYLPAGGAFIEYTKNTHTNHLSHDRETILNKLGITGNSGLRDFLSDPLELTYNAKDNGPNSGLSVSLGDDFINADNLADGFLNSGKDVLNQLTDQLGDVAGQVTSAIGDVCQKFAGGLGILKTSFLDIMGGMGITDLLAKYGIIIDKDHLSKLRDKSDIYKNSLDKAKQAKANMKKGMDVAKERGIKVFQSLTQRIMDKLNSMVDKLMSSVMDAAMGFVNGLLDQAASFVKGYIDKVKSFIKSLKDTITNLKDQFTSIYNNVKSGYNSIKNLQNIDLTSIEASFKALSTILNSISTLMNSIINSACSLLQSLLDLLDADFNIKWPKFHLPDLNFNIGKIVLNLSFILPDIQLHINFSFNTNFHLPNCPALADGRLGEFGATLSNLLNDTNASLDKVNDKLSFDVHVNENYTQQLVSSTNKFIHRTAEQVTDDLYKHLGINKNQLGKEQIILDTETGKEYKKPLVPPAWVRYNPEISKLLSYQDNHMFSGLSSSFKNSIKDDIMKSYSGNYISQSGTSGNTKPTTGNIGVSVPSTVGVDINKPKSSMTPTKLSEAEIMKLIEASEFKLSLLNNEIPEYSPPINTIHTSNGQQTNPTNNNENAKGYIEANTLNGYVDNSKAIDFILHKNVTDNKDPIQLLEPYLRATIIN